jgi:hypothetical protein
MADENDAGASYLAALKQSTVPQAAGAGSARAPAAPRPAQIPGDGVNPAGGADKRRSPRYRCQGSANIRELNSGVATWTTFTDISLHGCYVEASATYGVGAVLSMKFEANGFKVEATGEVRVSYPNLGMGISFSQMSVEDRERLRALVRSISRPSVILGSRPSTRPPSVSQSDPSLSQANPEAALQAMVTFFEDRQMMGREEFHRILRKHR